MHSPGDWNLAKYMDVNSLFLSLTQSLFFLNLSRSLACSLCLFLSFARCLSFSNLFFSQSLSLSLSFSLSFALRFPPFSLTRPLSLSLSCLPMFSSASPPRPTPFYLSIYLSMYLSISLPDHSLYSEYSGPKYHVAANQGKLDIY